MATGLNFQTQTIINSNLDKDSSVLTEAGQNNTYLFKSGKSKIDGVEKDVLRIKRDFVFVKDYIKSIRKRSGYDAKMCKATIDFGDLSSLIPAEGKNYCRLDIYLGIEGAEPYIYSTPWVQKGMPFWIEFTVAKGDTAANIATNLAKAIKKNHIFLCDKDLINVSTNDDEYAEKVAELGDTGITLNERGENAFGTYSQIVKDLRLPTAANYQWTHIRQAETPIVGAIYNQYIVNYCAPSTNDGLQAVGQRMESNTSHVFWVKNDPELIFEWETALTSVGTIVDEKNSTVTPVDPSPAEDSEDELGS